MTGDRHGHWQQVYGTKRTDEVSWFETAPETSLALIARTGVKPGGALIDIGGGASRLVDSLLAQGFRDLTVLDLSETALAAAKARLGAGAQTVDWIAGDVTLWQPARRYDLWHDRAAFHFLTDPNDRAAYVERLARALKPGGHAIIATFAADGPERCSGLSVQRYDGPGLARVLGAAFERLDTVAHLHRTPAGAAQSFQFSLFRRREA